MSVKHENHEIEQHATQSRYITLIEYELAESRVQTFCDFQIGLIGTTTVYSLCVLLCCSRDVERLDVYWRHCTDLAIDVCWSRLFSRQPKVIESTAHSEYIAVWYPLQLSQWKHSYGAVPSLTSLLATMRCQRNLSSEALISCVRKH